MVTYSQQGIWTYEGTLDDNIWHDWTTLSTTTTTTIQTYDQTWTNWTNSSSYNSTTGTLVWQSWTTAEPHYQIVDNEAAQRYLENQVQHARERESRFALQRAQERQERESRARAYDRASALFLSLLDPVQAELWLKDKYVEVIGSAGGQYWITNDGVHGNIVQVDEHGCRLAHLCVAPEMYDGIESLPTPDGWVGQLLAIKYDEEALRAKANFSYVHQCQHPDIPILQAA